MSTRRSVSNWIRITKWDQILYWKPSRWSSILLPSPLSSLLFLLVLCKLEEDHCILYPNIRVTHFTVGVFIKCVYYYSIMCFVCMCFSSCISWSLYIFYPCCSYYNPYFLFISFIVMLSCLVPANSSLLSNSLGLVGEVTFSNFVRELHVFRLIGWKVMVHGM